MKIVDLKTLVTTNITQQGASDRITGAEVRTVTEAIVDEVKERGVVQVENIADLSTISKDETNFCYVANLGHFALEYSSNNISKGGSIVASATTNYYWRLIEENNPTVYGTNIQNKFTLTEGTGSIPLTNTNGSLVFNSPTALGEGSRLATRYEYISTTDEHQMTIRFKALNFDNIHIGIGNDWRQQNQGGALMTKYDMQINSSIAGVKLRMKSGFPSGFSQISPVLAGPNALFLTAEQISAFSLSNNDICELSAGVDATGWFVVLKNITTKQSVGLKKPHTDQFTEYTPLHWGKLCIYLSQGNIELLNHTYTYKQPEMVIMGNSITTYPHFNDNVAKQIAPFYDGTICNWSVSGMISNDLVGNAFPVDLMNLKNKTILLNGLLLAEVFVGGGQTATTGKENYLKLVELLRLNGNRIIHVAPNSASYYTGAIATVNQEVNSFCVDDVRIGYNGSMAGFGGVGTMSQDAIHPTKFGATWLGKQIIDSSKEIFSIDKRNYIQEVNANSDSYLELRTKVFRIDDASESEAVLDFNYGAIDGKDYTFMGINEKHSLVFGINKDNNTTYDLPLSTTYEAISVVFKENENTFYVK
jgi:hypothetical protein